MLSRRQFLSRTAAGTAFVSLQGAMPSLFAQAAALAKKIDQNDRVLVVVELNGGNDGLNTVIPYENALYYRNRPTLGVPKEKIVKLTDQLGFPPTMTRAAELFHQGKLAVVQGVGYPKPDRSHFRSMEIWHTASTASSPPRTGWLGRVLDYQFQPNVELPRGLALTSVLPQAFLAAKVTVPATAPEDAPAADLTPEQKLLRHLSSTPTEGKDALGFLRRQAAAAYASADRIREAAAKFKSTAEYPGNLGRQLRRAAEIITADLGIRLLFLSQDGYDTHNHQATAQGQNLTELSDALAVFQQDLEEHRVADKVLVLLFSEFGRRVAENASLGTDHGAASCLFLAGTRVRGGLAGTYPSLLKLDAGDLIHTVDFRSVYATVLERWLGCPAEKLLGGKYPPLDLIQT